MKSKFVTKSFVVKIGIVFSLSLITLVETLPFPGIFPLLSTSWYYKPGPTESIVLGLLVVKLLALRLGATIAGVPYHLNDIFDSNILPFSKRSKRSYPQLGQEGPSVSLSNEEIKAVERILLALRRIDSHDCFIRYICQVHQNNLAGNESSATDMTWINIFKLKPQLKSNSDSSLVWNVYAEALSSEPTNCTQKYKQCPLTENDLTAQGLMSGLF